MLLLSECRTVPKRVPFTVTHPFLLPTYHTSFSLFSLIIAGILVPVYTLVLHFPVKHAITLTAVTVFGGALANNLVNASKRHPLHPGRPIVDWDVMLLLEPMTIGGALVGAIGNVFLPAVVLMVLLLVLLLTTSYLTLQKAVKLHQKECSSSDIASSSTLSGETQKLVATAVRYGAAAAHTLVPSSDSAQHMTSWVEALKLTALFGVVTVMNILKGGFGQEEAAAEAGSPSHWHLPVCGPRCFWWSNVAILAILLGFVAWSRSILLQRLREGGPVASDISWNEQNTVWFPIYAILAGLVAGLFGVGTFVARCCT
jgi:uncharacterized membrane protein YfcA